MGFFTETTSFLRNPRVRRSPSYIIHTITLFVVHCSSSISFRKDDSVMSPLGLAQRESVSLSDNYRGPLIDCTSSV